VIEKRTSIKKNFIVLNSNNFYSKSCQIIISKLKDKKVIVVTGGKSFIKIYKIKKFQELKLNQKYFLSDERIVSLKSKYSNYNNINKYFDNNKLVYFDTTNVSKKKLSEQFIKNYKFRKLDLSLLSFGEDGHIASIFFDKMKSERQLFFSHKKFNRISIPLKVLKNANETLVLCNNTKKTLTIIKDIQKSRNFFKYFDEKKYKIIIKKSDYKILAKKLNFEK
jgi:6-phosphogluconolactonase/glucosamine-6-phosphate isomerase/deaminase